MSVQQNESPASASVTKEAFARLAEQRQRLAIQAAMAQAQLRAVEHALNALDQNARGESVLLELTKDDAGLLMGVCYQFAARHPGLGGEACKRINDLGDYVLQAVYRQNADFAQRVTRMVAEHRAYGRAPAHPAQVRATSSSKRVLRKKDCPYLRHTADQMDEARSRTSVGSYYDYVASDYARLHLSRAALLEMYGRPRHLRMVYSYILEAIDAHSGESVASIFCDLDRSHSPDPGASRSRFYEAHSDSEMREELRRIGLSPGQVKIAYGLLTVSLTRSAVLRLYQSPLTKPAIAYLLRVLDEHVPVRAKT